MAVGAAMKAFQIIWNNPVITLYTSVHSGDFHCIFMFFFGHWKLFILKVITLWKSFVKLNYLHQEYQRNSAWKTIQPLLVDTWSICSSYRTIIWRTFKNIIIWKKVHSCTSSIPFQARNDFDLRLTVWEEMLLFCSVFNNVHYACYGTYYVN